MKKTVLGILMGCYLIPMTVRGETANERIKQLAVSACNIEWQTYLDQARQQNETEFVMILEKGLPKLCQCYGDTLIEDATFFDDTDIETLMAYVLSVQDYLRTICLDNLYK
ncbi:MAG: hypothetical protein IJL05_04915 [Alphaproteobacteria bacterium]|nr:hypothetical protein [Alphaproteobacteria bacterium]